MIIIIIWFICIGICRQCCLERQTTFQKLTPFFILFLFYIQLNELKLIIIIINTTFLINSTNLGPHLLKSKLASPSKSHPLSQTFCLYFFSINSYYISHPIIHIHEDVCTIHSLVNDMIWYDIIRWRSWK